MNIVFYGICVKRWLKRLAMYEQPFAGASVYEGIMQNYPMVHGLSGLGLSRTSSGRIQRLKMVGTARPPEATQGDT